MSSVVCHTDRSIFTKFRRRHLNPRHLNPPELNLGYVLNSGAHDPRDGTFATVVEDGWAGKAQSPPCRGRTVGFGLGNGLVSVTVVEKVVQRVRLGGRSPCGCEFLRLPLQRRGCSLRFLRSLH